MLKADLETLHHCHKAEGAAHVQGQGCSAAYSNHLETSSSFCSGTGIFVIQQIYREYTQCQHTAL